MKKSLTALAAGTFALGIAEFVMMGILPDVATNLGITIPQAGHFIAAYALGVCVGAPLLALIARSQPLKRILLGLGALILIGNLCTALAPDYRVMLVTRFISGCPTAHSSGSVPSWPTNWPTKAGAHRPFPSWSQE